MQCASLCSLSLHGNPITEDQLQGTQGFEQYDQQRRRQANKQVGVLKPGWIHFTLSNAAWQLYQCNAAWAAHRHQQLHVLHSASGSQLSLSLAV